MHLRNKNRLGASGLSPLLSPHLFALCQPGIDAELIRARLDPAKAARCSRVLAAFDHRRTVRRARHWRIVSVRRAQVRVRAEHLGGLGVLRLPRAGVVHAQLQPLGEQRRPDGRDDGGQIAFLCWLLAAFDIMRADPTSGFDVRLTRLQTFIWLSASGSSACCSPCPFVSTSSKTRIFRSRTAWRPARRYHARLARPAGAQVGVRHGGRAGRVGVHVSRDALQWIVDTIPSRSTLSRRASASDSASRS